MKTVSDMEDAQVARTEALPILTGQTKHQSLGTLSSSHQAKDSLLVPKKFLCPHMFTLVERTQLQSDANLNFGTVTSSCVPLDKLLNYSDLQLPLATRG